jgi:hypothetical protein
MERLLSDIWELQGEAEYALTKPEWEDCADSGTNEDPAA